MTQHPLTNDKNHKSSCKMLNVFYNALRCIEMLFVHSFSVTRSP